MNRKGGDELKEGDIVWLSCEVKPGPFPNERLIRLSLPSGAWVGFVEIDALKDPDVKTGETCVLARITKIIKNEVIAIIQAHAFDSNTVRTSSKKVQTFVPV